MDQSQQSSVPSTAIIPLRRDMARQAGAVLGRAFQNDPIQSWNFPNDARRALILPRVFTAFVRGAAASDGYITTTADFSAVAVWSPPGTDIKAWAITRGYGLDLPRVVLATQLSRYPGMVSFLGTIARRRKANVPEPHWYLAALGVDPPCQGRGLGKALVRDGLDRADSDGKIAYLETETENNVGFYQALGFDVVEEITIDRLGLPLWLMARDPQ